MYLFVLYVFQLVACNTTPNLMQTKLDLSCCFAHQFTVHNFWPPWISTFNNLPPIKDPSVLTQEHNFHKWMLDLITTHNLGVPSCLNTTLVHWNLFGFFNGWAMENKMYKVILLVFMNQGCAINLEHISILLELSPMDKSSTIFHWSGVTSTKWIDLSER